jgi:protein TonB
MTKQFGIHFTYILALHLGVIFGVSFFKLKETRTSQQLPGVMKVRVASQKASVSKVTSVVPQKQIPKLTSKPIPRPKVEETKTQEVSSSAKALVGTEDSAGRAATVKENYISKVRSKIEANKFYPLISRRMGQTGIAVVGFTLLRDGSIIDLHVHKSSKFDRLDASALDAVKKVGRFSPIPNELGESQLDITVPVKFYL